MAAEPKSPKPKGRTIDGGTPDQEKGARLVREWAQDESSAEEDRRIVALILKAYNEARADLDGE